MLPFRRKIFASDPAECSPTWTTQLCTQGYGLSTSEQAVADDLGKTIPEVTLSHFHRHILPPLPQGLVVDEVISRLKTTGVIHENRWTAFPQSPAELARSRGQKANENAVFSPLTALIQTAISTAVETLPGIVQRYQYTGMPNKEVTTIYDKKPSRPDGYFVPLGSDLNRVYWHQIGVSGEYKTGQAPGDVFKNRCQVIWSMYQQLREDPRRRFTLAYSIEDTSMRLWFANRSEMLVSSPFNFVQNQAAFLRFVLGIAFAEEHAIGWDPTMKLLSTPSANVNELMYDITVHSNDQEFVYRTKRLISDVGARSMRGRGTRVWEAIKIVEREETGDPVALKDSWVDADREREVKILERLRNASDSATFTAVIDKVLLTIDCCGDVRIKGSPDHTRQLHTHGQELPAGLGVLALVEKALPFETPADTNSQQPLKSSKAVEERHNAAPSIVEDLRLKPNFLKKQHHRAVFRQVGSSLYDQAELSVVFHTLADVTVALEQIHQVGAGWVHRDISPGNILVFPQLPSFRLADFEYAKEITDQSSHEVRTGTANFIAVEADCRFYTYMSAQTSAKRAHVSPEESGDESSSESDDESPEERAKRITAPPSRPKAGPATEKEAPVKLARPKVSATFFHNAIHDLESVWWIAVYFLFKKQVASCRTPLTVPFNIEAQRRKAAELFSSSTLRGFVMVESAYFENCIGTLHPSLHAAGRLLEKLRRKIVECYRQAEQNPSTIGKHVACDLYPKMCKFLSKAERLLDAEEVVVTDMTRSVPVHASAAESSNLREFEDPSTHGPHKRKKLDED